ncbi:MAG: CapA family protein [candidate division Zixibacteria bacterium]|nr:CapA family protein [Candidatus Tariuqbacter arcticus]
MGDIFLGNWAEDYIEKYGVDYPFRGCEELFADVDLVVGNLESPITEGGEIFPKDFNLKSPPGCQEGLFAANICAVNLANNHIMDYGLTGLNATLSALDSSNIKYFGAGLNRKTALKEASFTIKGQSFAFIGFSATFPEEFWATDSTPGTAFPWDEDIREVIPRLAGVYDVVVVSFHWSAEKLEFPKDYQVDLAHLCAELGADLIVGHHPHIAQGVELYGDVPIFYSLGNFAFASYSESARIGLVAVVDFQGGKAVCSKAVPLNVYNAEVNFQPHPLPEKARAEYFPYLFNLSLELNQNPIVITEEGEIRLKLYIPEPEQAGIKEYRR